MTGSPMQKPSNPDETEPREQPANDVVVCSHLRSAPYYNATAVVVLGYRRVLDILRVRNEPTSAAVDG